MRTLTLRLAATGLLLPLSLVAGFFATSALSDIAMHQEVDAPLAALSALLVLAAGGGLWARSLARLLAMSHPRRIAITGAASHAALVLAAVVGLGVLEQEFVEFGRTSLPVHVLFTFLFVPATFAASGLLALAVACAAGQARRSPRIALLSGTASALAFLALNVLQDLLGRRVGGPNAAETATMITVTLACNVAAATVFTLVLGRLLRQATVQDTLHREPAPQTAAPQTT